MKTLTESVCAEIETQMLDHLHDRVGPQKFNAWFKHGTRIGIEDDHVKVLVPNPFVANWIETHFADDIAHVAAQATGSEREVIIMIDPDLSGRLRQNQLDMQAEIVTRATNGTARPRSPQKPIALRHRLKEFVVGSSNKLAYSAAMAAARGDAHSFGPLFIHGSCGVGKTHLLQGICDLVANRPGRGPKPRWKYVSGEQFTNEYIAAVRKRNYADFRRRYRNLDLLAIDDVHFLAAKKATQEEFLHTFDAIESAGNRVVMASDAHPKLLGDLIEQLTSRFVAGMVVKIDPPDKTTRLAILRKRAKKMKIRVSKDAIEYVAANIRGSVRDLEGTLVKLAALAKLDGGKVTIDLARDVLADHLARTGSVLTLGDIEAVVGAYFGITPADLHSSRRTKTVSTARMVAMFLGRRHTSMSYPEIGRFMGKNHSSAVLAVQRMEASLASKNKLTWMTPMGPKSVPARKVVKLLTEQFS